LIQRSHPLGQVKSRSAPGVRPNEGLTGKAAHQAIVDLIRVKAGVRHRVHRYAMSEDPTFTNEVFCPVCGRPMILLHTIRRAFAENLNVFKCKPCGFSTTEPVSWTTPSSSQDVGAARHVAKRAGR
jgi:predicted RNA-binding Zn-ribbon protein involved in translation (DUF1610 family)